MKVVSIALFFTLSFSVVGQTPLYDYMDLKKGLKLPEQINRERSVAIVSVPDEDNGFRKVGDWISLSNDAHLAFATMGIDVVLYVNQYDLLASGNSRASFAKLFLDRNIKSIIFLTKSENDFEMVIAKFNGHASLIDNQSDVFFLANASLTGLLFETGKEVRRSGYKKDNFLIPGKPSLAPGVSIAEKAVLQNYPGILRRSKLSVERFAKVDVPENASAAIREQLNNYNQQIDIDNAELDSIMKSYPYSYETIEPMNDEDLLRARRQFVLRSVSGPAQTLRLMFDYKVDPSETDFVSVIPIMPDQTRAKPIPKNGIVHKFYIRQNISKNIHVGEWDADISWQSALENMIGNLIQEHNVDN